MRRSLTLTLAAVAIAVPLLGACGDDADEDVTSATVVDNEGESADEGTTGEAEGTDSTAPSDDGALPDACTLVEPAEVEELVGAAEPAGEQDTAIDGLDYSQCTWESDDSLMIVSVIEGPDRYEMHSETLPGEPLDGVGEEAITAPGVSSETTGATGGRTISALVDGKTLVVALKVPGQTTVEMVAPIATTIAERLAA